MTKTYYYHFNKFDQTFMAMVLGLGLLAYTGFKCPVAWCVFVILVLIWGYKNLLPQVAVVITDKSIKIDHSKPLAWKEIKNAEIRVVNLCGKKMKVLCLNPKPDIKYAYSLMQKYNANFGPFPIPLYGLLIPKDEKEILNIVKKHVAVKSVGKNRKSCENIG